MLGMQLRAAASQVHSQSSHRHLHHFLTVADTCGDGSMQGQRIWQSTAAADKLQVLHMIAPGCLHAYLGQPSPVLTRVCWPGRCSHVRLLLRGGRASHQL